MGGASARCAANRIGPAVSRNGGPGRHKGAYPVCARMTPQLQRSAEDTPLGVSFPGRFDLQAVLVLKKSVEHSSIARRAGRFCSVFRSSRARASSEETYFYA